MSKSEVIKWEPCLFVGHEFSHCTNNGNGREIAYFLAYGTILHKFMFSSCSQLANKVHALKPLEKVQVSFRWSRDKKELLETEPIAD